MEVGEPFICLRTDGQGFFDSGAEEAVRREMDTYGFALVRVVLPES